MSKYQITHSCGHEQTHQIFGPYKDRSRKEANLAQGLCSECYEVKKDADRKAAAEVALQANQELGLCQLKGSEKQVVWAEQIRAEFFGNPEVVDGKKRLAATPSDNPNRAKWEKAFQWIETQDSAAWWIDVREKSPKGVLSLACEALT